MKRFLKWLILPTLVLLVGVGVHWAQHVVPAHTPKPLQSEHEINGRVADPPHASTAAQAVAGKENIRRGVAWIARDIPPLEALAMPPPSESGTRRPSATLPQDNDTD